MEAQIIDYLHESFAGLLDGPFEKVRESNDNSIFYVEYQSPTFSIRIEKYHRDLFLVVHKTGYPDDEIDLFNLLRYLNISFTEFEYSKDQLADKQMLAQYQRKQIAHLSNTLIKNMERIQDFFAQNEYELRFADVKKYMLVNFPKLFKRE